MTTITHLMPDNPPDHRRKTFTLNYLKLPRWPNLPRLLGAPAGGRVHKSGVTDPIFDIRNKIPEPGEDLSVTMIPRGPAHGRNGPRKLIAPAFRSCWWSRDEIN